MTKGKPKEISVKAGSGNQITSYFCGDCGSTLWRQGATFGDSRIIKVGVMDDVDALDQAQPAVELYAPERVSWVGAVAGAGQKKAMPDSADV